MTAITGRLRLTAAESFWYVLRCIAFGGIYLAKAPVKTARAEAGLAEMTGAERFSYVLQCIAFGAGISPRFQSRRVPGHRLGSGPAAAAGLAGAYGGQAALGAEPDAGMPDGRHQRRHGDRGRQV